MGYSKLQIASQAGIARNTLKKYIKEFIYSGLSFEEINELSDKELEDLFVKPEDRPLNERLQTLFNLFPAIDKELKKKGVTRLLLWEEYKRNHPDGVGKSQFKHYFSQWKAQVNPTMHMEHKAGDKLSIIDRQTGEIKSSSKHPS